MNLLAWAFGDAMGLGAARVWIIPMSGWVEVTCEPSKRSDMGVVPSWVLQGCLPGGCNFKFPGKITLHDMQQGAILREKLLKLVHDAECDLGQQAVALGDQVGQIAQRNSLLPQVTLRI